MFGRTAARRWHAVAIPAAAALVTAGSCEISGAGYDDQRLVVRFAREPIIVAETVSVFAYLTLATGDVVRDAIGVVIQVSAGSLGTTGAPVAITHIDTTGAVRVVFKGPAAAGSVVLSARAGDAVATDTIAVNTPPPPPPPPAPAPPPDAQQRGWTQKAASSAVGP